MNSSANFSGSPDPMARKYHLQLAKPSLGDPTADVDRVLAALSDLHDAGDPTPGKVAVPLPLVRRIGRILRESSFRVTAVLAQGEHAWELIDLLEGHEFTDCYGLGIDIGTTTVSVYLANMTSGEIAGKLALANPQIAHGEDILSRIHYCQNPGGLETLRELIVGCLNQAVTALTERQAIRAHDICAISVAGNPAMTHFFLGLDPYHLCREPYVPVVNRPLLLRAEELMIGAHPDAPVYVFPCLGSYFGGDVVAGILASGMHRKTAVSLLVDVGTNAEIVLGNCDWLVVCAGAAGPALEGGGAKAGMCAKEGAIETVRIDRETLEPTVDVIGDGPARGICGSGFIDLVAELYLAGAIDPKGRIGDRRHARLIQAGGDARGYMVVAADEGKSQKDIVVDELDIGNLLRAKGAMYTALTLITERLGVGFNDLETFFVTGSFGEHIDPEHAVTIGMLPDIPRGKFRVLENGAGLGACMLLRSFRLREEIESIRRKTTYLQLTTDNEFMHRLNAAIFIPHTNRELFPSVPIYQDS